MTVCGDQTFLEQMKWSFQFSISVNDLYIAIFMQFNGCLMNFKCQVGQIWIIDTRSEYSDMVLNWHINCWGMRRWIMWLMTYLDHHCLHSLPHSDQGYLRPITPECQKTINMHSGHHGTLNEDKYVCVAIITNGMTQTQLWTRCAFWAQMPKLKLRNIFAFTIWVLKPGDESEKGGGMRGWGWGGSSQNMGFCQVRIDGAKY